LEIPRRVSFENFIRARENAVLAREALAIKAKEQSIAIKTTREQFGSRVALREKHRRPCALNKKAIHNIGVTIRLGHRYSRANPINEPERKIAVMTGRGSIVL
jgi:prolyl-tRNA synthetase